MVETVITSSVLIIAVLLLRTALKGRVSNRLRYGLWLIAAVRLLLPFPLWQSSLSVMNLFSQGEMPYVSSILPNKENAPEGNFSNDDLIPDRVANFPNGAANPDNSENPAVIFPEGYEADPYNSGILDNIAVISPEENEEYPYNSGISDNPTAIFPEENEANPDNSGLSEKMSGNISHIAADNLPLSNNPESPFEADGNYAAEADKTAETSGKSLPKIIAAIWAAGAVMGLLWLGGVNLAFYIRLRKSRREVRCASPLPVYRADFLKSPCLFGKAIYINEKSENRLKYIIAHEYSHYRHRDNIWAAVRGIILCVYWFDPLVWAAAFISKRDCECACDEAAMEIIGEADRLEYGKALIEMIPRKGGFAGVVSTSMSSRGRALEERLKFIAAKPLNKRSAKAAAAKAAAIALLSLACGCTFTTDENPEALHDKGIASHADIASNADIAVISESPDPARNERQYQVNSAHWAYETYLHTFDNYKEFYENHAGEVYADSLTVNPEEFGEFSAFFNLWIKYRNKTMETVRVNYSPEEEKFYADEPFEVSYIPEYLTLLPDKPYEEIIYDSWNDYLTRNYPCDLYDNMLFDEPVEEVWIIDPCIHGSNAYAGFVMKSKSYYRRDLRSYYPDSVYPDEKWSYPRGTGDIPHRIADNPEVANEGSTLALTREEYYSRQKYHPGDVLHSFKKQVPLSDGSGMATRTVQLVMTGEDYPNGLPYLNYTLQGDFALRILDGEGNVTGECPLETAAVDVNGNMSVTVNDMYLSRYFKYSKNPDRLLVFSVPNGYYNGGWHSYTAFFGITDEGKIFRYHVDDGEFDYPAYMGGNELFTGELYSNSRLYSESGALVNRGGQYLVNIERQRNHEDILNVILFDETTHLVKNAYTLKGDYNEELLRGARDAITEKFEYLFLRHINRRSSDPQENYLDMGFKNFESITFEDDCWEGYVNMPMGEISGKDLFYALSAEAEERHPGYEDMLPYTIYGDKEYVVEFYSDYMGEAWTYASDAVMTEQGEDGSYYVYFVSFGCDYYSVCRYTAREKDGKWVLGEFAEIL